MERLTGVVQHYAWGSTTLLSGLRGDSTSDIPEAELWYGAHRSAPSVLGSGGTLLERIEGDPVGSLGDAVVGRFGAQLPFLLKLLAAARPLSIQAHPSLEKARAGFAFEEAAGIDRSAPNRSFRDDNHKPELICALTPFEALVGFRESTLTTDFLTDLNVEQGAWLIDQLRQRGPKGIVEIVLDPGSSELDDLDIAELSLQFGERARAYGGTRWSAEADVISRLDEAYAGDPGVVVAALLNTVTLQPGEALYLGAGNLHAYIGGLAVEIMANSDNVLRGGLTPKHIDVPNLLDALVPDTLVPELVPVTPDGVFNTPAPDFSLTRHEAPEAVTVTGPAIIIVASGAAVLADGDATMKLEPTEAAWVGADDSIDLSGEGLFFSASVGASS